jgi:hypothetical protein
MSGAMQNFLDAQLQDNVRVGADPGSARRHFPQHRVESYPGLSVMNRVEPYQYAINIQRAPMKRHTLDPTKKQTATRPETVAIGLDRTKLSKRIAAT